MVRYYKKFFSRIYETYFTKMLFILVVFTLGLLIGYIYQSYDSSQQFFKDPGLVWYDFFFNNLKVAGILVVAGFISYGIGSALLLFYNGLVIGIAISMINQQDTILFWKAFFPHAIIELPAILFSCIIPYVLWNLLKSIKKGKMHAINIAKYELYPLIFLIVGMLFVASIIEGYFSSVFIK